MNRQAKTAAWVGAAILLGSGAGALPALAQTGSGVQPANEAGQPSTPPVRKSRSVRKPVVDLEGMAKERRAGQVMPGDPAPYRPATPAKADAAPEAPTIIENVPTTDAHVPAAPIAAMGEAPASDLTLPNTVPWNRPVLRPQADGTMRDMNTRPVEVGAAPMPAEVVKALEDAPLAATDVGATTTKVIARAESRPQVGGVTLVDGSVLSVLPSSLGTAPAKVRVESVSGDPGSVQWKGAGEAWRTPVQGDMLESVVEVRAGLDAQLVLVVDDKVQVRISRLGRAMIERSMEAGGATSVSVTVARGAAEVRSIPSPSAADPTQMFARVRTPDQNFGLVGPLRVEYDAFTGTRRRVVNP